MPVTVQDYILRFGIPGVFVRLVNNSTSTAYVSSGPTDANGLYTITAVPAGIYTVYTGSDAAHATIPTGDMNYEVNDPAAAGAPSVTSIIGLGNGQAIMGTAGAPVSRNLVEGDVSLLVPDLGVLRGAVINVKDRAYGALGDGRIVVDGGITAGTNILSSATAAFTPADVGKLVNVEGAGANPGFGATQGRTLSTTIASYADPTHVTLTVNATTTVAGARTTFGTDDTVAILAANTAAAAVAAFAGVQVLFPAGRYHVQYTTVFSDGTCAIPIKSGVQYVGSGAWLIAPAPTTASSFTIMGADAAGPSGWSVKGLRFDGSWRVNTETQQCGVQVAAGFDFVIKDCEFTAFGSKGILINGAVGRTPTRFWIQRNYAHDKPGNAWGVNFASDFLFADNIAEDSILRGDAGSAETALTFNCTDFTWARNISRNWGNHFFFTCARFAFSGNECVLKGTDTTAAASVSLELCSQFRIVNNHIDANGRGTQAALSLVQGQNLDGVIGENVIIGNAGAIVIGNSQGHATPSQRIIVTKNTCASNTLDIQDGSNHMIEGNICGFIRIGVGGPTGAQCQVRGNEINRLIVNGDDCLIVGNQIIGDAANGPLQLGTRSICVGNLISTGTSNVSVRTIFMSLGGGCVVAGNIIRCTPGGGAQFPIQDTSGATVGNYFADNYFIGYAATTVAQTITPVNVLTVFGYFNRNEAGILPGGSLPKAPTLPDGITVLAGMAVDAPFYRKEGANKTSGVATLSAGAVTVSTNMVDASSRIYLTAQEGGTNTGFLRVSARTNGTSFTITSSNNLDNSPVAWQIIEAF